MFLIAFLIMAALTNLISALGPELGFDALWYHLTIPKLYLTQGSVSHLPGGLLYYSEMPRLTEFLYLFVLDHAGETGTHLLNWLFGLGTALVVFLIARQYTSRFYSLLAAAIFYVTPIVGFLSGSAYVDLERSFWEALALLFILRRRFFLAGVALGLAISTKTLALGTLGLDFLIVWVLVKGPFRAAQMAFTAVIVSFPWFGLAFLTTGFPLYPIGAGILDQTHSLIPQASHPLSFFGDFWKIFLRPGDLISPIYVLILPFFLITLPTIWSKYRALLIYCLLSYFLWWLTPRTGGGRFILPYLAIWAILVSLIISRQEKRIKFVLIIAVLVISLANISYRLGANYKLKDYLLGKESTQAYLCQNLNFSLGVFVDCDGYFASHIKKTDLVFVSGVHNLYYIDFPFVHETWFRGGKYNYVLTQNQTEGEIKKHHGNWLKVYENSHTNVTLYRKV